MAHPNLTVGALQLTAAGTIASTAALLEVDTRTVSSWRSGSKRPSPEMRHRIEQRLGIEASGWLVSALALKPQAADESAPEAAPAPSEPPERLDARERLRAQIARLAAARATPCLTDRARVDFERLELAASRELARLEGRDITQAQILGSPHWTRLESALVLALEPWPDAMLAIAEALERVESTH